MDFSTTTAATIFDSVTADILSMLGWALPYIVGFVLTVGIIFWLYKVAMSRMLR